MRTVAFVGSRKYASPEKVKERFHKELENGPFHLVSGGCPNSPDTWAQTLGEIAGVPMTIYKPERPNFSPDGLFVITVLEYDEMGEVTKKKLPNKFHTFGQAAFFRNGRIAEADKVIAFWDGESKGTKDTIDKARALDEDKVEVVE